jgi:transposase InsO family protein
MAASSCADALISSWVSSFGVPAIITSDRGAQFTSGIWDALCSKLGVKHSTTLAYHPQSNGLVERAHRQLKEALESRLAGATWSYHLPWVLLGLRAAPKDDSNISSAELVYGVPLVLPGEFVAACHRFPGAHEGNSHIYTYETPPPRPGRFHSELLQAS